MTYQNFSETLRDTIQESGYSMRRLAKMFNIPYRTMQNWKEGVNVPPLLVQNMILAMIRTLVRKEGM